MRSLVVDTSQGCIPNLEPTKNETEVIVARRSLQDLHSVSEIGKTDQQLEVPDSFPGCGCTAGLPAQYIHQKKDYKSCDGFVAYRSLQDLRSSWPREEWPYERDNIRYPVVGVSNVEE